jgi:D-lactate dehydrogenase
MTNARDVAALPPAFRSFRQELLAEAIPAERLICDPLRTFALGTDASFYRLVPRVVVQVQSAAEVAAVLRAAARGGLGCTFRAGGTSLSGQAVTDAVLVRVTGAFRRAEVRAGGRSIALEPGVIGAEANALLAPYGRKIGPDPASIGAAMIGGIAANNASGMCCGTAQSSYRTVEAMRLVLADGGELDTGVAASRAAFAARRPELLEGLAGLRREVLADPALTALIRRKYAIKNTTGYSLNALIDFEDPFDILQHLVIGSEGTLAFIAEITYRTVEDHPHRASALVFFPDMEAAARATQRLETGRVSAVELMDRPSLRAVQGKPGLPPELAGLPPEACALLVEVRGESPAALQERIGAATALLEGIVTLHPVRFTTVKAEFEALWDVRRGLFPAVGAARRIGTTVVIEDVAFPMQHLAAGVTALQGLLQVHGYAEGIIFGHALDGNVHFVFTQDFAAPAEVERYRRFLEDVAELVVTRFGGSLKAEHGTGRNMAPFVAREWGPAAYGLMRRVKQLFDPAGILNPGVLLNDDPGVHLKDLKPLPETHELVDRCIECGFCEPRCPSRALTLTPRQRIAVRRELSRLARTGEDPARAARLAHDFAYQGDETCATDGLCATACPVSIDTGKLIKILRAEARGPLAGRVARAVAGHYGGALAAARAGMAAADVARAALGAGAVAGLSRGLHRASGRRLPVWNAHVPRPAPADALEDVIRGKGRRVVYFPSCITRLWGPARGDADERAVSAAMLSLLEKAGYDVLFPRELRSLCCGLTFDSKGFPALADEKCRELEAALRERTGGDVPVLCDTSPCVQRMRAHFGPGLPVYEPAEFIQRFLADRLRFVRKAGTVAVHVTCSMQKLGLGPALLSLAQACAERVVAPAIGCCAFAGDRGLTHPELNASALAGLHDAVKGCEAGYSNSRGCEIGLSQHGGIPYQSIVHLVDRCTVARE